MSEIIERRTSDRRISILQEEGSALPDCSLEECRKHISTEVAHQLQPLIDKVSSIDKWKSYLYGNGSGKKGYLEIHSEKQEVAYEELAKKIDAIIQDRAIQEAIAQTKSQIALEESSKLEKQDTRRAHLITVLLTIIGSQAFMWAVQQLPKFFK